jgi:hypothetical protein
MHLIASSFLAAIEVLSRSRAIPFFLDFHGHTGACNSFVYGFMNEKNPDLYSAERVFPLLMTKHTPLFSNEMCSFLKQECYEGTMRVTIRRRFLVLFAYTLEMSYGGSDFGPRHDTQFTPHDYRSIGEATVRVIGDMFLGKTSLAAREVMALIPPPEEAKKVEMPNIPSHLDVFGVVSESKPQTLICYPNMITLERPDSFEFTLIQCLGERDRVITRPFEP